MFERLWMINKREEKKLRGNKKALLFLLAVPILYTLLFGFLYSPHVVKNISTVVVDQNPTQLSRTIISGFEKSERFAVQYYTDEEESALELMNKGLVDVMIIIPEDFTKNIKSGETDTVLLGVNSTNSIIGNSAYSSAMQIVKTYSSGVMLKTLEGQGLVSEEAMAEVSAVSSSFRPWYNPQYSYENYLLLGIIAVALQQIILMSVSNSFAREHEEGSFGEMLEDGAGIYEIVLGKSLFYFVGGMVSLLTTQLLAFALFKIPLRGSFFYIFILGLLFYVSVIAAGLILSVFCKNQTESIQLSMLMAYPTFLLTGYTWPSVAIPGFLVGIGKFLPLTYFSLNLRNIALMGVGSSVLWGDLLRLGILSLGYLLLAIYLYRRWLQKEGFAISAGKEVEELV